MMAVKSTRDTGMNDALKLSLIGIFKIAIESVIEVSVALKEDIQSSDIQFYLCDESCSVVRCYRLLAMLIVTEGYCEELIHTLVAPLLSCNKVLTELKEEVSRLDSKEALESVQSLIQLTRFVCGFLA